MSVRYAGFWVRLVADILDSLLLNILAWLAELIALGAFYWVSKLAGWDLAGDFWSFLNTLWVQILNLVIYVALAAPYYVIGHTRYGTTLGKRPFSIYVEPYEAAEEGRAGERLTLKQSWIRFFAYGLSYLPFAAGFLMAAFHPEKRGLHDFLAGSVSVIRKRARAR